MTIPAFLPQGIFGSIFGGYAWLYHAFYLAGEVNADVTNAKSQTTNDEFVHQNFKHVYYRMRHAFGVSILPGYLYTPNTVFYARAGYSLGNFNVSSEDASLSNMNRNVGGICLGVGINHDFTPHLAGRVEYKQVNYQSAGVTTVTGTTTKNTNIAPITGQVEFALMYNVG